MSIAVLIEQHQREFLVKFSEFGVAGVAGIVIAGMIAIFAITSQRKQNKAGKLPKVFWLFLGSGICLIVLSLVLSALEGPVPVE